MSLKQEDYKVKAYFNEVTGNLKSLTWTNQFDQEEAPGDLPSMVIFSPEGVLISAFWRRGGKSHRDGDLPARIYFDDDGRPTMWCWEQNGQLHRDGDKPAEIGFIDGSRQALTNIAFYKDGEPYREGGKETSFEFDPDGTAYDPGVNVIPFEGFDESWLPSPVPTLINPQPALLKLPQPKP